MTKKELKAIQLFIEDIQSSNDRIEVFERLYRWLKVEYMCQGKKKLGYDFKELDKHV